MAIEKQLGPSDVAAAAEAARANYQEPTEEEMVLGMDDQLQSNMQLLGQGEEMDIDEDLDEIAIVPHVESIAEQVAEVSTRYKMLTRKQRKELSLAK